MGRSGSGRTYDGSEVSGSRSERSEKRRSTIDDNESTTTTTPSRMRSRGESTVSTGSGSRRKSSRRDYDERERDDPETPSRRTSGYAPDAYAPSNVSSSYVTAVDRDADNVARSERHGGSRRERDYGRRNDSNVETSRGLDNNDNNDDDRRSEYSRRDSEKTSTSSRRRDSKRESTSSRKSERRDSRRDSQMESSRALSEQDHNAALPQNQFPGAFPEEHAQPYRPPGLASEYYGDQGESVQFQPGVRPNKPSIIHTADQAHLHEPTIEAKPPPEPSSVGEVGAAASYFAMDDDQGQQTSTPSRPAQFSTPSRPTSFAAGPPDLSQPKPSAYGSTSSGHGMGSMGAAVAAGAAAGFAADYYLGGSNSHSHQQSTSSQTYQQSTQQHSYSGGSQGQYVSTSHNANGSQSIHNQGPQNGYASSSKPSHHGSSGPGLGTTAAAGLAAAGAAAYYSQHHNQHSHAQSQSYQGGIPSGPDPNFTLGQNQSAFPNMQQQRLRHKHRGPIGKFVDWFRDPQGVAQFEAYTESIGVCKYCFDPHSSPLDAPRKHHYHHGRPSSVNPTGVRTSRVSKVYRHSNSSSSSLSSSDLDQRRKKSSMSKKVVAAGLAGVGAAKIGEAIYKQKHDFDDTYSVRSGIPQSEMQQRMSTNAARIDAQEQARFNEAVLSEQRNSKVSRYESTEDIRMDRKTSTTSRRSRRDSDGERRRSTKSRVSASSPTGLSRGQAMSIGAGAAAVGMAALAGAEVEHRRRSRSRSRSKSRSRSPTRVRRKKSYYSKRISPRHSYVDLSTKNTGPLGFGGFFSSPSANEKKGKRSKGFFALRRDSSSSSDLDLAFGEGTVKRKNSRKGKSRRDSGGGAGDTAAILGLAAAGAALAAEGDRKHSKSKSRYDTTDGRTGRESTSRRTSDKINLHDHETASSAVNDEGIWEDASDDDSIDTALAYGGRLSTKTSRESLAEQGTSKWAWRWNKGKEKRKTSGSERRQSETYAKPGSSSNNQTANEIALAAASVISRDNSPAPPKPQQVYPSPSPSTLPPMQWVDPIATSNPMYFDARRPTPSEGPSPRTVVSRSPAPLKQPQPHAANMPIIPTTLPTVIDKMEAEAELTGSPDEMTQVERRRSERRDSRERVRPQHRDSSPPLVNPSMTSRNSVAFKLTEEQIEAERRAIEKQQKRQRSRDDNVKRSSGEFRPEQSPSQAAVDSPSSRRRSSSISERERREAEIQAELDALYAEQARQLEQAKTLEEYRKQHGESGGIAGAIVGAGIGAAATAMLKDRENKKSSESDRSETDGRPRRKSSLKKTSMDQYSSPSKVQSPPKSASPPKTASPPKVPSPPPTIITQPSPRAASPPRSTSPPKETQQDRIARMAAQKIKRAPSPVHEDYSTFFVPTEMAESVKDHNEAADKRVHDVANILTIGPDEDGNPTIPKFDPFVYKPYGSSSRHDATRYGWNVPFLELVEPTPPGSRSASRTRESEVDIGSPVSPAKGAPVASSNPKDSLESLTDDDLPRAGKPTETSSSTGSKVKWGQHNTYEYEVQSPESERNDPVFDQDDLGKFLPLNGEPAEAAQSEPLRKVYTIESEDSVVGAKGVPPVERTTAEQRGMPSKGDDRIGLTFDSTTSPRGSDIRRSRSPVIEERAPSPSPDPSPAGSPVANVTVDELLNGSKYRAPFKETTSDLGEVGDYAHREVPKTGHGFVEESSLPPTPAASSSKILEDNQEAPSEPQPVVVVEDVPLEARESRSQRRRLERALSSSENVTPLIRTPQHEPETVHEHEDEHAVADEPPESHGELPEIMNPMPGGFGVFDYLVDDDGNPMPASSAHNYEDAVKSVLSQRSQASTKSKQEPVVEPDSQTPPKPSRSMTYDESRFEREVPKTTDYASDPEDWERQPNKKSTRSKESASKSDVGFGNKAAMAAVAAGVMAATAATTSKTEPDFYEQEKEKSRDRKKKKRESEIFDDYDGKSTVSTPGTRDEDKKSRRRSKRDSEYYDDDETKSVTSMPATKDEDKKSRKKKRDSDVFKNDDDDTKSITSTTSEKRRSKGKEMEKKPSSGGLFSAFFGKSSDVSTSSRKSTKSSKSESKVDRDRDKDDEDREKRKKRRSKGEGYYDDAASMVSEPARPSRHSKSREAESSAKAEEQSRDVSVDDSFVSADEQADGQESFLAERPDMPTPTATVTAMDTVTPMGTDGVSGLKSESSIVTPLVLDSDDTETETAISKSDESSSLKHIEGDEHFASDGEQDKPVPSEMVTPLVDRTRRLSAIRTSEFQSSPALVQSPTAVPVFFGRRYPVTPNIANQNPSRSSPILATPTSPVQSSRPRQSRPKSYDFQRGEYRPLYLVESHSASKAVPPVDETLPSLPSSRSSSAYASTEDLRGQALAQLEGQDDDDHVVFDKTLPQFRENAETGRRSASPDFLDSRSATPVPGEKQRARDQEQTVLPPQSAASVPSQPPLSLEEIRERKAKQIEREREMKLAFHSPSELLQDPVYSEYVRPQDVDIPAEDERAASPLPSVVSNSQDEEFMSAESGRATPVFVEAKDRHSRPRSTSREPVRSKSRSRSRSRSRSKYSGAAIAAGLVGLGGIAAGVAASKILDNKDENESDKLGGSERDRSIEEPQGSIAAQSEDSIEADIDEWAAPPKKSKKDKKKKRQSIGISDSTPSTPVEEEKSGEFTTLELERATAPGIDIPRAASSELVVDEVSKLKDQSKIGTPTADVAPEIPAEPDLIGENKTDEELEREIAPAAGIDFPHDFVLPPAMVEEPTVSDHAADYETAMSTPATQGQERTLAEIAEDAWVAPTKKTKKKDRRNRNSTGISESSTPSTTVENLQLETNEQAETDLGITESAPAPGIDVSRESFDERELVDTQSATGNQVEESADKLEDQWIPQSSAKKSKKDKKKKRTTLDLSDSAMPVKPEPELAKQTEIPDDPVVATMQTENKSHAIPIADDTTLPENAREVEAQQASSEQSAPLPPTATAFVPAAPVEEESIVAPTTKKSKKDKKKRKGNDRPSASFDDLPSVDIDEASASFANDSESTTADPAYGETDDKSIDTKDIALGVGTAAASIAAGAAVVSHHRSEGYSEQAIEETNDSISQMREAQPEEARTSAIEASAPAPIPISAEPETQPTDTSTTEITDLPTLIRTSSFQPTAAQLADPYNDLGAFEQAFERAVQCRGLADGVTREEALDAFLPKRNNAPFVPKGGLTPVPEGTPGTAPATPSDSLSRKTSKKEKRKSKKGTKSERADPKDSASSLELAAETINRQLPVDLVQEPDETSMLEAENPFGDDFDLHPKVVTPEEQPTTIDRNPFGTDYDIAPEEQVEDAVASTTSVEESIEPTGEFSREFEPEISQERDVEQPEELSDANWASINKKDKKKTRKGQHSLKQTEEIVQPDATVEETAREVSEETIQPKLEDVAERIIPFTEPADQPSETTPEVEDLSWATTSKKDKKKKRKSQLSTPVEEIGQPETPAETSRDVTELGLELPSQANAYDIPPLTEEPEAVKAMEKSTENEELSWASTSKRDKKKKRKSQVSTSLDEVRQVEEPIETSREIDKPISELPPPISTELPLASTKESSDAEFVADSAQIEDSSWAPSGKKNKKKKSKGLETTSALELSEPTATKMQIREFVEEPAEISSKIPEAKPEAPAPGEEDEDFSAAVGKKSKKDKKKKKSTSDWTDTVVPVAAATGIAAAGAAIAGMLVDTDGKKDIIEEPAEIKQAETSRELEQQPEMNSTDAVNDNEDDFASIPGKKGKKNKKKKSKSLVLDEWDNEPANQPPTYAAENFHEPTEAKVTFDHEPAKLTEPTVPQVTSELEETGTRDLSVQDAPEVPQTESVATEKIKQVIEPAVPEVPLEPFTATNKDSKAEQDSIPARGLEPTSPETTKELVDVSRSETQSQDQTVETTSVVEDELLMPGSGKKSKKDKKKKRQSLESGMGEPFAEPTDMDAPNVSREIVETDLDATEEPMIVEDKVQSEAWPQEQIEPAAEDDQMVPVKGKKGKKDKKNKKRQSVVWEDEAASADVSTVENQTTDKEISEPEQTEPETRGMALDAGLVDNAIEGGIERQLEADSDPVAEDDTKKMSDFDDEGSSRDISTSQPPPTKTIDTLPDTDEEAVHDLGFEPITPIEESTLPIPQAQPIDDWTDPNRTIKKPPGVPLPPWETDLSMGQAFGLAFTGSVVPVVAAAAKKKTNKAKVKAAIPSSFKPYQPTLAERKHESASQIETPAQIPEDIDIAQRSMSESPADFVEGAKPVQLAERSINGAESAKVVEPMHPTDDVEIPPHTEADPVIETTEMYDAEPGVAREAPSSVERNTESISARETSLTPETQLSVPQVEPALDTTGEVEGDNSWSQTARTKSKKDKKKRKSSAYDKDESMTPVEDSANLMDTETKTDTMISDKPTQLTEEPPTVRELEPEDINEQLDELELSWDHGLSKKDRRKKRRDMEAEGIEFDENDQPLYPSTNTVMAEGASAEALEKEFSAPQTAEMEPVEDVLREPEPEQSWDFGLSKKDKKKKRKAMEAQGIKFDGDDQPIYSQSEPVALDDQEEQIVGAEAAAGVINQPEATVEPSLGETKLELAWDHGLNKKERKKKRKAMEAEGIEFDENEQPIYPKIEEPISQDITEPEAISKEITREDEVTDPMELGTPQNISSDLETMEMEKAEPEEVEPELPWDHSLSKKQKKQKRKEMEDDGIVFDEDDRPIYPQPRTSSEAVEPTIVPESQPEPEPVAKEISVDNDEWTLPPSGKKAKKDKKKRKSGISTPADELPIPTEETALEVDIASEPAAEVEADETVGDGIADGGSMSHPGSEAAATRDVQLDQDEFALPTSSKKSKDKKKRKSTTSMPAEAVITNVEEFIDEEGFGAEPESLESATSPAHEASIVPELAPEAETETAVLVDTNDDEWATPTSSTKSKKEKRKSKSMTSTLTDEPISVPVNTLPSTDLTPGPNPESEPIKPMTESAPETLTSFDTTKASDTAMELEPGGDEWAIPFNSKKGKKDKKKQKSITSTPLEEPTLSTEKSGIVTELTTEPETMDAVMEGTRDSVTPRTVSEDQTIDDMDANDNDWAQSATLKKSKKDKKKRKSTALISEEAPTVTAEEEAKDIGPIDAAEPSMTNISEIEEHKAIERPSEIDDALESEKATIQPSEYAQPPDEVHVDASILPEPSTATEAEPLLHEAEAQITREASITPNVEPDGEDIWSVPAKKSKKDKKKRKSTASTSTETPSTPAEELSNDTELNDAPENLVAPTEVQLPEPIEQLVPATQSETEPTSREIEPELEDNWAVPVKKSKKDKKKRKSTASALEDEPSTPVAEQVDDLDSMAIDRDQAASGEAPAIKAPPLEELMDDEGVKPEKSQDIAPEPESMDVTPAFGTPAERSNDPIEAIVIEPEVDEWATPGKRSKKDKKKRKSGVSTPLDQPSTPATEEPRELAPTDTGFLQPTVAEPTSIDVTPAERAQDPMDTETALPDNEPPTSPERMSENDEIKQKLGLSTPIEHPATPIEDEVQELYDAEVTPGPIDETAVTKDIEASRDIQDTSVTAASSAEPEDELWATPGKKSKKDKKKRKSGTTTSAESFIVPTETDPMVEPVPTLDVDEIVPPVSDLEAIKTSEDTTATSKELDLTPSTVAEHTENQAEDEWAISRKPSKKDKKKKKKGQVLDFDGPESSSVSFPAPTQADDNLLLQKDDLQLESDIQTSNEPLVKESATREMYDEPSHQDYEHGAQKSIERLSSKLDEDGHDMRETSSGNEQTSAEIQMATHAPTAQFEDSTKSNEPEILPEATPEPVHSGESISMAQEVDSEPTEYVKPMGTRSSEKDLNLMKTDVESANDNSIEQSTEAAVENEWSLTPAKNSKKDKRNKRKSTGMFEDNDVTKLTAAAAAAATVAGVVIAEHDKAGEVKAIDATSDEKAAKEITDSDAEQAVIDEYAPKDKTIQQIENAEQEQGVIDDYVDTEDPAHQETWGEAEMSEHSRSAEPDATINDFLGDSAKPMEDDVSWVKGNKKGKKNKKGRQDSGSQPQTPRSSDQSLAGISREKSHDISANTDKAISESEILAGQNSATVPEEVLVTPAQTPAVEQSDEYAWPSATKKAKKNKKRRSVAWANDDTSTPATPASEKIDEVALEQEKSLGDTDTLDRALATEEPIQSGEQTTDVAEPKLGREVSTHENIIPASATESTQSSAMPSDLATPGTEREDYSWEPSSSKKKKKDKKKRSTSVESEEPPAKKTVLDIEDTSQPSEVVVGENTGLPAVLITDGPLEVVDEPQSFVSKEGESTEAMEIDSKNIDDTHTSQQSATLGLEPTRLETMPDTAEGTESKSFNETESFGGQDLADDFVEKSRDKDTPMEAEADAEADEWAFSSKKSKKDKKKRKSQTEDSSIVTKAALAASAAVGIAATAAAVHESSERPIDQEMTHADGPREAVEENLESLATQAMQRPDTIEADEWGTSKKSKKDKKKKKLQSTTFEEGMEESTSGKASAESLARSPVIPEATGITTQDMDIEEQASVPVESLAVEDEWIAPGKKSKKDKKKKKQSLIEEPLLVDEPTSRNLGDVDMTTTDDRSPTRQSLEHINTAENDVRLPDVLTTEREASSHQDKAAHEFESDRDIQMTGTEFATAEPPANRTILDTSNDTVETESIFPTGEGDVHDVSSARQVLDDEPVKDEEEVFTSKKSKKEKKKKNRASAIEDEPKSTDVKEGIAPEYSEDYPREITMAETPRKDLPAGSGAAEVNVDARDSSKALQIHTDNDTSTREVEGESNVKEAVTQSTLAEPQPEVEEDWAVPGKKSKKDKKKRKSTGVASESSNSNVHTPRESHDALAMPIGLGTIAVDRFTQAPPTQRHSAESIHRTQEHPGWPSDARASAPDFGSKSAASADTTSMRGIVFDSAPPDIHSETLQPKGKKERKERISLADVSEPAWQQRSEAAPAEHDVLMTDKANESDNSNVSESTRERRKRRRSPPLQRDHDPDDLPRSPRDRAMTPPPEHDDLMDTALGIAAGLGIGATQDEPLQSKSMSESHLRDSGVQFESPGVPQANFPSNRDSGYVPSPTMADSWSTSRPEPRRPTRPHSPTSSAEDVRAHRRSFHTEPDNAHHQRQQLKSESREILETPAKRQPSPVDATSKDRSSVLFNSSPAGRTPKTPHSDKKARGETQALEGSGADAHRSPRMHGHRESRDELKPPSTSPQPRRMSNELSSSLINRSEAVEIDRSVFSPSPVHSPERPFSPGKTPLHTIPEVSSHQLRHPLEMGALAAGAAAVGVLAASARDDPTARSRSLGKSKSRTSSLRDLRGSTTSPFNGPELQPTTSRGAVDDPSTAAEGAARNMADSYEGYGAYPPSPRSPTRPPSVKKRQSMQQIRDLETRVEQLASENRSLAEAKIMAERHLEDFQLDRNKTDFATDETLKSLNEQLRQRDEEITKLREQIETLVATHETLKSEHDTRYTALQEEHSHAQTQWQESSRELEGLRGQHEELSTGMEEIVRHQIDTALAQKEAEIQRLRQDLDMAREKIRQLQSQILARGADEIIVVRDEDYFDNACQTLCQHVQQWVLRFSKFSDTRVCFATHEVRDEKVVDRFDNAILDGSDVDVYLADRIKRRDVFMSVVMTMIWEYVFTRYLFGMDRDQRQKIKQLEKNLGEVGSPSAVHQWRAITLTLLAKREAFRQQRESDTEAVVLEVMKILSKFLPPPQNLEGQIYESLRKVMRAAVDLSIEMRTQKAVYIMLPPLQPEYDTKGDLARKVYFNASLMNERSGETTSNEELEASRAVVQIVLFPLVVKEGDDSGQGSEKIVICPAQVLVARPDKGKRPKSRLASGGSERMSVDQQRGLKGASTHSLGAMSGVDMGNVI